MSRKLLVRADGNCTTLHVADTTSLNPKLFKSQYYMLYILLTLIPLVADDDEESDTCAECVDSHCNSTKDLRMLATHGVDDILITGTLTDLRAVDEDDK